MISYLVDMKLVGVKFPKSTMGLGPRIEPNHDQKGKGGPKDFQPNPVEPSLFKKTSEERCLFGHTNTGPMCVPSTVKNHPKQTWVVG